MFAKKFLPVFILRCDKTDAIASISENILLNKWLAISLIQSTMKYFIRPYLWSIIPDKHILDGITTNILCVDIIDIYDDIKAVTYMCVFNIYGNR